MIDRRAEWLQDEIYEIVDILYKGTKEIRRHAGRFLPKSEKENSRDYQARVNRTTLFPAYANTVKSFVGRVFHGTPNIDTTPSIEPFLEDITLFGDNAIAFFREVFQSAVNDGVAYVLIDHTARPEGSLTLAETQHLRPFTRLIRVKDLIDFQVDVSMGYPVLTQFRFKEAVAIPDGEWGSKLVEQIRVYNYGGTWEIYRKNDKDWYLYKQGENVNSKGDRLIDIPVVPVYTEKTGFFKGEPYLKDLAYLNIEHFQVSSNLGNILYYTSVPILVLTGINPRQAKDLVIAENIHLALNDPASKVEWVELSGGGVKANQERLKELVDLMDALAVRPLLRETSNKTATQVNIENSETMSELQMISIEASKAFSQVLQWLQLWVSDKPTATVELAGNFVVETKDYDRARLLLELNRNGSISRETLLEELKEDGLLSEDFDAIDEIERLDDERPAGY
jgi:hypothetical protein